MSAILPILSSSVLSRVLPISEVSRRTALAGLDASKPADVRRALALYGVRGLLSKGDANPKIMKGQKARFYTEILHLAPSTLAMPYSSKARDVCSSASDACRSACLNCAGRGGIALDEAGLNEIQIARIRRTVFLWEARAFFLAALRSEIERVVKRARVLKMRPAVRLNGTSDLPWIPLALAPSFPRVRFYDYTKHSRPWTRGLANYHLTFSRSESNERHALEALAHGVSVAVVFRVGKGKALPATWQGYRVIDGDETDLRFLDPAGVVVGLRAKGPAKKDASGFVVAP